MACSLFGGSADSASSAKDSKYLGEEYRSESGGFSIKKANDYTFTDTIGIINMIAPGGDQELGPGIMVVGGLNDEEMTNEDLLEKMRRSSSDLNIGKSKSFKINDIKALSSEITGSYNDTPVKGKVVVAMVNEFQQFTMLGFAPEEKWQDLSPVFEAVLTSVEFFEPNPDAEMQNSSDSSGEDSQEQSLPSESQIESSADSDVSGNNLAPGEIAQWAIAARASSQYGNPDWSASQAIGEPDVAECGDSPLAWASRGENTVEWLELTYEIPVYPTRITIIQNFNPSQVVEVQMIATDGSKYIAWEGYAEYVDFCPDYMEITLDMFKKIKINKLRITIDQRELNLGWNEIDAVQLVGTSDGPVPSTSSGTKPEAPSGNEPPADSGIPAPTNYSGWMAGKNYQGYASIEINKTRQKDLDKMIGMTGKRSTENWKPRPDHKDTYIYEFPEGMKAYVSVLTDGTVYRKSIAPAGTYPKDYKLNTVTEENYKKLDAIYKKDKKIPYNVMANLLESPGFIRESYFADDKLKTQYEWYAPNGDRIGGFFLDGMLTGMAGLVYIPKE
jgi:hypothetical protein